MDNINESEQWKLQGNCIKCRRKEYCGKSCKAHNNALYSFMYNALDNKTGGILSALNVDKYMGGKL